MTQPLQTCTWSSRIASQIPNTSVPIRRRSRRPFLDTPTAGTIAIVGPVCRRCATVTIEVREEDDRGSERECAQQVEREKHMGERHSERHGVPAYVARMPRRNGKRGRD